MPIKFRRIEDRAESVIQQREREAVKRERSRLLPKLIILVVVVALAVVVYGYFYPPKIVASFIVHVDPTYVTAPVEGTLVWMLPPATERVIRGDVLARIRMQPTADGSPAARLSELRLRAAEAGARIGIERAARGALEADLTDKERGLNAEVSRLKDEVERAGRTLAETQRRLEVRVREARSAEQLKRLDAITFQDYETAQEAAELARAAAAEAQADLKTLEEELASVVAARELFRTTRSLSLAAADSRIQAATITHEALTKEVQAAASAFADDGEEYVVYAPLTGPVLSIETTEQSRVEQGTLLAQVYDQERVVARAFVPERYKPELRREAPAHLYVPGIGQPLEGQVGHVQTRVTRLPQSLAERLDHDEASVVAVDIRCAPANALLLVPGQIGRAVIEK